MAKCGASLNVVKLYWQAPCRRYGHDTGGSRGQEVHCSQQNKAACVGCSVHRSEAASPNGGPLHKALPWRVWPYLEGGGGLAHTGTEPHQRIYTSEAAAVQGAVHGMTAAAMWDCAGPLAR